MIGTSSCHLSYLEDYPIAYFVFFCIFLSCISFFTNWAWVRCVWKQHGQQVSPAYIFGFLSVSVCVYFIVLVFCISIFHILHFWQNKLSRVRLEAAGLEPAICLAFEDLCLYLFYLYLCCLYFFISVFFYFIFHIEYGVIGSSRPSARHLPGLWGFEASTRGAGAAAGQMPATPLLSISPLPSFGMSPSIQPYKGDSVLCLPVGNTDYRCLFSTNACISIEH